MILRWESRGVKRCKKIHKITKHRYFTKLQCPGNPHYTPHCVDIWRVWRCFARFLYITWFSQEAVAALRISEEYCARNLRLVDFFCREHTTQITETLKFAKFSCDFGDFQTIFYNCIWHRHTVQKSRILAHFRPIWHNIWGFWMIIHTMSVSKSSKSLQEPDDFSLQRSQNTKI